MRLCKTADVWTGAERAGNAVQRARTRIARASKECMFEDKKLEELKLERGHECSARNVCVDKSVRAGGHHGEPRSKGEERKSKTDQPVPLKIRM